MCKVLCNHKSDRRFLLVETRHTETSQMICNTKQFSINNGFHMM